MEQPNKKINSGPYWLYIISPCVLAAVFCLIGIADSYLGMEQSRGWNYLGVIILFPFLLVILAIDAVVKYLSGKNALKVWLSELFLLMVIAIAIALFTGFL